MQMDSPCGKPSKPNQAAPVDPEAERLQRLRALEQRILWLAVWMIHHANHVRPKADGLKVGGHQASSASLVTLMTALYFDVLRPQDRVAVKPHASPVFHAISTVRSADPRQVDAVPCVRWRAVLPLAHQGCRRRRFLDRIGGTRRGDDELRRVGAGTTCASRAWSTPPSPWAHGRSLGDAEFDEGNVFEALFEG
jgi:pyruvate dehydrogenase E1 component